MERMNCVRNHHLHTCNYMQLSAPDTYCVIDQPDETTKHRLKPTQTMAYRKYQSFYKRKNLTDFKNANLQKPGHFG